MPDWLFTVRERFTPASARTTCGISCSWEGYLEFSGFQNLQELITLDSMLCPQVIDELTEEDWNYNVHEDFRLFFFRDAEWLRIREPRFTDDHQILAVFERPTGQASEHENIPDGFVHCGFDIMDAYVGNSVLTNCGQIPEAFSPADVNEFGLLPDCRLAGEIRDRLRKLMPSDPHLGACDVWSIARRLP